MRFNDFDLKINKQNFMKVDYSKKANQSNTLNIASNIFNYADTLKLLKETEERLEKRKKEIRVESMKSGRGKWRASQQQKKLQMKGQVQAESKRLQEQFSAMRVKQLQKIAQMKKESQRLRQESLKRRSMTRVQLLQTNIRKKYQVREQSMHHTEKIIQQREQELQKKRQQRLHMYGSRKQSRLAYQKFHQSRVCQLRSSKSRERDKLLQILKKRQEELNQLQKSNASSRLKIDKQPSTTQNLRAIDSSLRIYNPSSFKKTRKRAKSQYPMSKQGGTLITMI